MSKTKELTLRQTNFAVSEDAVVLKPGKYLVVDPCYVVPEKLWGDFCTVLPCNKKPYSCSFKGSEPFFVRSTAYGDGTYKLVEDGELVGECGVDAGLLSIIPESLVKLWNSEGNYSGMWPDMGGAWVEIEEDTEVKPYGGGSFRFGDFKISTE